MTCTATPATRRTYITTPGWPEVDAETVTAQAIEAAKAGHSLAYSCPYPFRFEAGQHFVAVYYLNRHATPSTARVLARSAHALELSQ